MFGWQRMMTFVFAGLRKMDLYVSRLISFNSDDHYPELWMVRHCLKGSACAPRADRKMHVSVRSRLMRHLDRVSRLKNIGRAHCGLCNRQCMCPNMRFLSFLRTERSLRFASSGPMNAVGSGTSSRLPLTQTFSGW